MKIKHFFFFYINDLWWTPDFNKEIRFTNLTQRVPALIWHFQIIFQWLNAGVVIKKEVSDESGASAYWLCMGSGCFFG